MTFWEHFLRLLPRRPTPALAALYWQTTRRKVRARNRLRIASADLPFAYAVWIAGAERAAADPAQRRKSVAQWAQLPRFSIILHGADAASEAELRRSAASAEQQSYPHWTLIDAASAPIADSIAAATADFIVPLRAGDRLAPDALFRFAEALQGELPATILYGDHDRLDRAGNRSRPWFKPRWNEHLFLAQDYLAGAVAIEADAARTAAMSGGGHATLDDLLLAATAAADGAIVHIPHVLAHLGSADDPDPRRAEAVSRHLGSSCALCVPGPFGTTRVQWPLPDPLPLVSIIVPTKDKLELLAPCVAGVLERTDYPNFELIIVDNGSVEPRTAQYFASLADHPKVRVLAYPRPYNFSAINNFAVKQARGAFLCLLNNDTEVVTSEWLSELMRYAVRPDVGAAGAKLLYEDGSIQHAGVVVGIGEAAGHAHRFLPNGDPGYFRMAHVAHFVSAVTAACLVVEKRKFEAVGGLDEDKLAIAFNDVDLCLKIEAAGWRNVYVPHAVLIHHETKSRGRDEAPQNIDRYRRELAVLQERWGTRTYDDPLHNPNLDRYSETFVFRL